MNYFFSKLFDYIILIFQKGPDVIIMEFILISFIIMLFIKQVNKIIKFQIQEDVFSLEQPYRFFFLNYIFLWID